ncbi:MAG: DNA polymerase III subunit [Anaerolineae bacterium]|nr:DNA polymerase III subunit [Anaerolineae bacterium]
MNSIQHWRVFGHDWAVEQLQRSLIHQRIRHAYLIVGAESVGKETLARAFAMALNCLHEDVIQRPCFECRICRQILSGNHADVLYSQSDPNSGILRIEEVRLMTGRIALKPFDARYRVAIFRDFDNAQPRAQDALLKTLEEPPPHAVLVLLARSQEPVLSTITSRSQMIHLRPASVYDIHQALTSHYAADDVHAEELARLSGGRVGWAIRGLEDEVALEQRSAALDLLEDILSKPRVGRFALAEDLSKDKLALIPLLELWQSYWRDLLLSITNSGVALMHADRTAHLSRLAALVSETETLIALHATQTMLSTLKTNANVRLALEVMFLDYPGLIQA